MAKKREKDLIAKTNSSVEIAVCNSALPSTIEINVASDDFQLLLDEKLPEIAPELKKLAPERNKYSFFSLLLIMLFVVATGYTVYRLFPRPRALETVNLDIPLPYRTTYSGKHSATFSNAEELFKRREYHQAAQILQNPVADLLTNFKPHDGDAIFYRYFSIFNILEPGKEERDLLNTLIAKDPDQISWKFFKIVFNPLLHGKIALPPDNKLNVDEDVVVLPTLREIEFLRTTIVNGAAPDENLIMQLDYYQCCLYYYLWRCQNYDRSSEKESRYREEAEAIARRYEENLLFLEIRKAILEKRIEQTRVINYPTRKNLRNELNSIVEKIKASQENN